MLKIGLDFINLRTLQDGMGRFTSQFIRGVEKYDHKNEYFLFFSPEMKTKIKTDSPNIHINFVKVPLSRILPRNQVYFSLKRHKLPDLNVIHSPVSLPPNFIYRFDGIIATIHDLAFKLFPETIGNKARLWWNTAWPRCLKRAEHLVAISQNTKKDLHRIYNIPNEKISVIHNSVANEHIDISESHVKAAKKKYDLPDKYILHVGAPHKRKNHIRLIKAFKRITENHPIEHHLVLVGPKGWDLQNISAVIKDLNMQDRIMIPGFIPDQDLPAVYHAADVFVFPSLYEGFGYPPLEAMAFGTPVVASNTSSLAEVIGDAGLLVDPLDDVQISDAVIKILSSPELSNSLRQRGLKHIKQFSLEKKMNGYFQLYEKLAK